MREIREYNMNGTIILGVDNGYGNVKTAHRVFPTGIMKCDSEPVLSKEYIEYDGAYYIIGEGHKGFVADKQEDDDTYSMTLAAIAKELEARGLTEARIHLAAIKEEDKLHVFDRNGMYLATKKIGKNNPKAAEIEADNMERVRWNQTVDRALISRVAKEDVLNVKREKISEEVKRSVDIYGNNPSFLVEIIRLAIRALELLISKVLLAAAKIAERVMNVVHKKVVEKEVPVLKEKPEQVVVVQEEIQLPKKLEEPLLLSKYLVIMKLDAELKRRNEEIFVVEQERGNLEIELAECTGVFKHKLRKELQERITLLDKKVEKMKAELSKVLRDAGYANAAEFFTELLAVSEEKRRYEEACKVWQEECIKAEISINSDAYFNEETVIRKENRGS